MVGSDYHISLIRRRGYYNFQHAGPRGDDCSRATFTQGRRLLEGGSNNLQVPVN